MHLPRVGVAELTSLEVNDDKALEAAMKKYQVNTEPAIAHTQPPLPADKGEVVTQFQQEIFQTVD